MEGKISRIDDQIDDTELSQRFQTLEDRFPKKMNAVQKETYGDFTTKEAEEFYQPLSYSD